MKHPLLLKREDNYFAHGKYHIPATISRGLAFEKALVSEERELELSVSSDLPYKRWYYYEELAHTPEAVNLDRFNNNANVLFNHNRNEYLGVINNAWLKEGKLYVAMRFDTHDLAQRLMESVNNGTIRNVSIGYEINELVLVKESDDDLPTYRATRWMPLEFSLVTLPADFSVGVGRSIYVPNSAQPYRQLGFNLGGEYVREKLEVDRNYLASKTENNPSQQDANFATNNNLSTEETKTMTVETPSIDEARLLKTERERCESLLAAGSKYNCQDLAKRAIAEGWTIERLRSEVLDLKQTQEVNPVASAIKPVGMTEKERRRYSVLKAIGYAAGHLSAKEVGLELEVSRALTQRIGKSPKKLYIDQAELVSYRAPYETGVAEAAGDLISTDYLSDRFIDQLYNLSAFLSMGVTYLRDLTGNVEIPRESSYTGGYWVGEKQTIPEDEGTFDKITMSPNKLAVLTKVTFEMIEQAAIDLEVLMRSRLLRGLALELDRTIGFGSGIGNEPLGIVSHPETRSVVLGVNGGELDWAALIAMQTELFALNATGNFGYVVNARTKGKLQTTLDQTTGGGNWIWQSRGNGMDGAIAGYMAKCSNQIPNNLSKGTANNLTAVFFGDFSNVLLGLWSGMEILANPFSQFEEAIIQVRAMQLADLQLTRGDYFSVVTDAINT